jgi:triosephosphate isomerase
MFGLKSEQALAKSVTRWVTAHRPRCEVVLCPPATLLPVLRRIGRGGRVALGGQTCHAKPDGAHTGDISAEMLADAGARFVIVGHSERRTRHGETDQGVAAQTAAAWRAGLEPIVCIGETQDENLAGSTETVLSRQIAGSIPDPAGQGRLPPLTIAYEPVWAIGTGRTPSTADIARLHARIHALLAERFGPGSGGIRVLYGGSMKPDNAQGILTLPGVDGALVGGASLKAADFIAILGQYGRNTPPG